ncbi:chemokine-like protein orion isoform 1-T1 [Glossina fuscipes fuscipes]
MKLLRRLQLLAALTLSLVLFLSAPAPANALVDDALDVFHIVKEVTLTVLKAWNIVQESPGIQNLDFPLAREKQRKVLTRLKEVSKQIAQIEDQHAEQIAVAVDSVNNYVESYLKLLGRRTEMADIINRISSRFQQMQKYEAYQEKLETSTLLDFAKWTVSPNAYSVHHLMERLSLIMFGAEDKITSSNMFDLLIQSYEASKEERCHDQQSTQQFLYSLYSDIALTELKGYTMMEFSWMMLRIYGKGNFTQESELMREGYHQRTERTVRLLREVMNRADRIVWRCDPQMYKLGQTYEEVTRLIQGYIENEVDMNHNRECWRTCEDYEYSKSEGCFKDKFCARQERCTGHIHNCRYVDSDMFICQSGRGNVRRYEYVQYENGITFGEETKCTRGTTQVDSWWRYLFWHCTYCFCYCDDIYSTKTDRYFNLRETLSDVAANKVVTGLRFTKQNRVFHLQIQEGELSPRGVINKTSLAWKPVENYTLYEKGVHNNRDYYTLSYGARSIDLDDILTDDHTFVVTGVRFRVMGAHLNLEARLTEFNFETGKLVRPESNSFWKSNDNTDVSGDRRAKIVLNEPDMPTRTKAKSIPDSRHNQYIEFGPSSMRKDAGQSTVPFIDTQDVVSYPSVPLAGIGIYHKGRPGYGGFLAPKLLTYDFTPHIQPPRSL